MGQQECALFHRFWVEQPLHLTAGIDFLLQRGFAIEQITAIRMVYGADTPWLPQHIYSRIGGNHG